MKNYLPRVVLLRVCSIVFAALALVSLTTVSSAQTGRINRYTTSTFTASFNSIVGQGGTVQLVGGVDDGAYGFGMPFAFNYDSTSVSAGQTIYAISNGMVSFGTSNQGCCSNNLGNSGYPATMCYFSYDLVENSGIYYQVSGNAPSRVLTIEFVNTRFYSGSTNIVQMQVKLYEGSNWIEYFYSPNGTSMGSNSAGIGLNGYNSPTFQYLTVQTGSSTPSNQIRFRPPVNTDAQLTSSPKVLDFGSMGTGNVATKDITIKNLGVTSTLHINSISIAGAADYTIVSAPANGSTLAPGATGTITVQFAPTTTGVLTGTVTIGTDGRDSGTQSIGLTAIGLAPLISVDTNILFKKSFTKLGMHQVGRILVRCDGAPMFFTGFPISGIDADQYAILRTPTSPLLPGQSDTLIVQYNPTREGRRAATLTITSNALNNPALPIQLIGTGILPHIVITPSSAVRFDSVAIGDSVCKTISIWNPGTDTLIISSNLKSSGDPDFTYYGLVGADTSIAPDKTKTVTVCFKPKQRGVRLARLAFKTNIIKTFETPSRDTAGLMTLDVQGTGVPFGVLSQSAQDGTILDTAIVGTQVCVSDTLYNDGQADLVISGITITGSNPTEFATSGITFPFVLKAGSSVPFMICSTPEQSGLSTATLTVNASSDGKPITLVITANTLGLKTCLEPAPLALFDGQLFYKGSTTTLCDTVTNCGEVPATYTVSLSGTNASDYSVTPATSAVVAPGGTAVFCVTYTPSAVGASPAVMTIAAANTTSQTVTLGGAACCAHLVAEAFTIPPTNAGGHSTFTVTVDNSGGCDWLAGDILIEGDTSVFHVENVGSIAGNGNKQVTIHYDPTDVNHTYTARVSFPNGGPCQEDTLAMNLSQQTGSLAVQKHSESNGFVLGQNRPNPFATTTTFTYTVPTESAITLTLSDMTGKLVSTITTGRVSAGDHVVALDAKDLASGSYIITLTSGNVALTSQIVVTK